jgi:hypothetical protein
MVQSDPLCQFMAVHARHDNVREHKVELLTLEGVLRSACLRRDVDLVSGPDEDCAQQRPDGILVIDDQEPSQGSSMPRIYRRFTVIFG